MRYLNAIDLTPKNSCEDCFDKHYTSATPSMHAHIKWYTITITMTGCCAIVHHCTSQHCVCIHINASTFNHQQQPLLRKCLLAAAKTRVIRCNIAEFSLTPNPILQTTNPNPQTPNLFQNASANKRLYLMAMGTCVRNVIACRKQTGKRLCFRACKKRAFDTTIGCI